LYLRIVAQRLQIQLSRALRAASGTDGGTRTNTARLLLLLGQLIANHQNPIMYQPREPVTNLKQVLRLIWRWYDCWDWGSSGRLSGWSCSRWSWASSLRLQMGGNPLAAH
jgi:hypothetical protein